MSKQNKRPPKSPVPPPQFDLLKDLESIRPPQFTPSLSSTHGPPGFPLGSTLNLEFPSGFSTSSSVSTNSSPCIGEQSENDIDSSSNSKRRKWSSSVWSGYHCYDGSLFPDNIARAICKYCGKGPILANSNNGTTNFKRHTETCYLRVASDVNQLVKGDKQKGNGKKFDHAMYKQLVAMAIIQHGYSFTFAEHEGNRAIHSFLNEDCRFISRNTARKYCFQVHKREKLKLKKYINLKVSSKVCLTTDMWSSIVGQGYLSLTAHYIDDDWTLHKKIIAFCYVPPPHNANMIHEWIIGLIKEWSLQQKVFSITLDNAKYNDNMQEMLANSLSVYSPLPSNGDCFHVRCGAHILNLIVQDGLKVIEGTTRKIKALVKYVTSSEPRKLKFRECAIGTGVNVSKSLWLDCPTRWNSTYKMLERALIYCPCYENMKRIDKDTPDIPTQDDWSQVEKIYALLKPFDDITKQFSGRNYPTTNLYFKSVWKIECLLVKYSEDEDDLLKAMAKKMKVKFDKYWDCYSIVLSLAVIMDPRYKFHLIQYCFEHLDPQNGILKANHIKNQLYELFAEYARNDSPPSYNLGVCGDDELPGFSSFTGPTSGSLSQLDLYLEEAKIDHNIELDVLQWWKSNESRHPEVARMARDLLTIPITTVASESAFSLGGRVLTKYRASLHPDIAEALIAGRSWLFGYDVKEDLLENGLECHLQSQSNEVDKELEDDEVFDEQDL